MQVKVHAAKTRLSQLIEAALRGEEVIIARGDTPVVRLVPVQRTRFQFGIMAAELQGALPDFLAPMSENHLRLWEGGREKHPS